jgi:transposase
MKPTPKRIIKEAIRLLHDGLSSRNIAAQLKVSYKTVQRIAATNSINVSFNKGGRPRKIEKNTVEHIKLNLKRGLIKSAAAGLTQANQINPVPISISTLKRRLREAGLIAKRQVKRPALKPRHIRGRMQFVKKYKEWTEDDWAKVIWSDESKINRICSDGIQWVWDDLPGAITSRTVEGTVKFGGGSVIVWSCMSWNGPGYIAKIDETLDSNLYIQILQEDLHLSVDEWEMARDEFIFQHDNDPKHTAKVTKAYLESAGLTEDEGRLLYWPAQSPDLNPIEHMWHYLKRQLGKYPTPPKSCHELWERISTEWYKIPVEFCRNLIRSMPRRLRAVYKAKGRQTKY